MTADRPSTPADLPALLEFASDLARRAGRLTLGHFGRRLAPEIKADGTPVTLADRECEALLRTALGERFPEDGILGEEGAEERPGARRRWILDPIDGTRSFMRAVPLYAVLIGLEIEGVPSLGVAHFPALDETVAAARGQGCHLDGVRCSVSDLHRLDSALVLTTDPRATASSPIGAGWAELCERADTVRGWGDAYGHMLVATGRAEAMVDPELSVWDAAPLLPIVQEAGGRFTTLEGEATIHGGSGVSTNGRLHAEVLEVLRSPGAQPTG